MADQARTPYGQSQMHNIDSLRGLGAVVRILRMATRYRWRMGIGVACTVIAAFFQLLIPQFLGDAVDIAQGLLGARAADPD